MNNTIGIYYETPEGKIAYTYGWGNGEVSYRFDDDTGGKSVTEKDFQTWKPRSDLTDFPNARDPRLPYVFDLFWDIKYTSDLKQVLEEGHKDLEQIKAKMIENNITV